MRIVFCRKRWNEVINDPASGERSPIGQERRGSWADVAQISPEYDCTLSRLSSADGFDLGPARGREAVHDGDADLDLGGLAVGVS